MQIHGIGNQVSNPFGGLDEVDIGEMGVARRGPVPAMPKQLADQRQVLARHDGLAGCRVAQVVEAQPAEPGIARVTPSESSILAAN